MNFADIAVLAIMLISIIIGVIRGFWKSISKVIVLVLSIVMAFTLADKISGAMFSESALANLNTLVSKGVLDTPYTNANVIASLSGDLVVVTTKGEIPIVDALKRMLIPSFLHGPIIASAGAVTGTITLGALVASAYTHLVAMVIGGGIIFLVSFIVFSVVAALIYKAFEYKKFHKAMDRILGGVLRILTSGMFIAVLFNFLGAMSGFSFMQPVMEQIENGAISGFIYHADFLNKIFYGEGMQKLLETFKNVIISAPPADAANVTAMVTSLFL